ncbi:MAG: PadR family transcriptional regulator [Corynebacterium sp.]|nr:PadR family transcriptional regulator [Corynebacterium sp.]
MPKPHNDGRRAPRGFFRNAILFVLLDGPSHGYDIMARISELTNGWWNPGPGTIYPNLSDLEERGLVTSKEDGDRKTVEITDDGREFFEAHREDFDKTLGRVEEFGAPSSSDFENPRARAHGHGHGHGSYIHGYHEGYQDGYRDALRDLNHHMMRENGRPFGGRPDTSRPEGGRPMGRPTHGGPEGRGGRPGHGGRPTHGGPEGRGGRPEGRGGEAPDFGYFASEIGNFVSNLFGLEEDGGEFNIADSMRRMGVEGGPFGRPPRGRGRRPGGGRGNFGTMTNGEDNDEEKKDES